jgi:glycine/D-amino acid oxidase-like deaminating enzyme
MTFTIKNIILAGGLLASSLAGAAPAGAMPLAPETAFAAPSAPIEQAGWRCGPGWHVNPWGRCVPSRRVYYAPRPVYRRPYYRW